MCDTGLGGGVGGSHGHQGRQCPWAETCPSSPCERRSNEGLPTPAVRRRLGRWKVALHRRRTGGPSGAASQGRPPGHTGHISARSCDATSASGDHMCGSGTLLVCVQAGTCHSLALHPPYTPIPHPQALVSALSWSHLSRRCPFHSVL